MKMKFTLLVLGVAAAVALLAGCLRDTCSSTQTYVRFDPVYKTTAECRVGISAESPRPLKKPGKMYAIGDYLLINEVQEGIHVIDNSDPANPTPVAFWSIPGNVDMAIRDHYLYADQYIDLLSIDISDLLNPTLVCRSENVFQLFGFDPARGFLVEYVQTNITEEVACDDVRWGNNWFFEGDVVFVNNPGLFSASAGPVKNGSGLPAGVGSAGSYSRFGQYDQYLYCVDNNNLRPFSVASPACPTALDPVFIGWNIETIFPWKNRLFVGSQTGVFIFNVTDPARPVHEAAFSHATGCDPVVCDDQYAYVTIHDGTTCNGTFNQLDIIDIRNLPAATLSKTYPMKKPKGVSVAGSYLFLCDDGLKVFDKTDPLNLKELSHVAGIETYDVIALGETHILVVGDGGFYQYDVSDPAAPRQISSILVTP
ncbi:MAG: hypothetical protein IPH12_11260 [Saprospirales bacterium]|jgi:hypothetical protein|nr:hypothetical protein [Saprospirales bacterium]MBK8919908.1 hypothetical protein [Saprospirales bacterium]